MDARSEEADEVLVLGEQVRCEVVEHRVVPDARAATAIEVFTSSALTRSTSVAGVVIAEAYDTPTTPDSRVRRPTVERLARSVSDKPVRSL